MYRFNCKDYYVFPGGGVEQNEKLIDTLKREIAEETTLEIEIKKKLYEVRLENGESQHYYLTKYLSGQPKLAKYSIEKKLSSESNQVWEPRWSDMSKLGQLLLYPLEVRDLLIEDYNNNFPGTFPKVLQLTASQLKQNI